MSAAWKKTSHERWNRVVPIPYYSHLLIIAIIHLLFPCRLSLYPISPCPRESTRLRKTGTIWKQNWHHCHCKQWNHMRVDSHWTFTPSPRAYTVLRMFTARRWLWFHANIMHTCNQQQKRMVRKEFIISGIIDWNTGIDANTRKLDNGLYAPDIYMSDETSEPTVDDSDREPLTGKAWNPSSLFMPSENADNDRICRACPCFQAWGQAAG